MRVKMLLPALTEARSPFWRPLKYSLFPPLGLATLAAYLDDSDDVSIEDEHVDRLDLSDSPDVVAIQVYITSAYRAYELADLYRARGAHVCLGGPHVTSLPEEALRHADTVFLGPGEDTWPAFLGDFCAGRPARVYQSRERSLLGQPRPRRDLIKRHLYLVPNSIVVSRGCPHGCDFCYKASFYRHGRSFYTQAVDDALSEIDTLPGRHLYFLDDHLFGDVGFISELIQGMHGMGRVWQAAATVRSILAPGLMSSAAEAGLRSLFVGFETLQLNSLRAQHKAHNLDADYSAAIRLLRDLGIMVNGSFILGLDDDDPDVFERTVHWAVAQGVETATFHVLTPYPGTELHRSMVDQGRITTENWDLCDTRHAVFRPARMTAEQLEAGYRRAYREFYRWDAIVQAAWAKDDRRGRAKHLAYASAWKKCETAWKLLIRAKRVAAAVPLLEGLLSAGSHRTGARASVSAPPAVLRQP